MFVYTHEYNEELVTCQFSLKIILPIGIEIRRALLFYFVQHSRLLWGGLLHRSVG